MKRRRIIVILVAVLLAGVLVVFLARTAEPSYQGHTLSEWVNAAWIKSTAMRPVKLNATPEEAVAAIKAIGTNAIPTLLRWSQTRPSAMKSRLNSMLNGQRFITFRFEMAQPRQLMAEIAFRVLGNDALPALPALEKTLRKGGHMERVAALDCVFSIDTGSGAILPVLLRELHNSDTAIQSLTARYLGTTYPAEAEQAGAFKLFPEFTPYQPKPAETDSQSNQ